MSDSKTNPLTTEFQGGVEPTPQARIPTFAEAAASVRDRRIHYCVSGSQGGERRYRSLELHVLPHIGTRLVSDVGTGDVFAVLQRIWTEKPAMARKVLSAISGIMTYAVVVGLRTDNPAGPDVAALPRQSRAVPRPFVPHHEVRGVLDAIRGSQARASIRLAFEFLVLTAARSGEVLGARWDEMDLEAAVWTIASERMISRREHRVPLPSHGLAVLTQAREVANGDGLVFPNRSDRPISSSSLPRLLRTLGIAAVPHGFRRSFMDWCAETGVPQETAAVCLAHRRQDVEFVFCLSDLLEPRRKVLEDWGRYVSGAPSSGVMGG